MDSLYLDRAAHSLVTDKPAHARAWRYPQANDLMDNRLPSQ
jgi:hypothetical protein